jgi:hypothetical protein
MMWLARLLGWATLLAIPCFLLTTPYQHALASLAMGLLASAGAPARIEVDLHEPFSLGLYAALCLASRSSPLRHRLRAVTLGLPALAAWGLLAVLAFVVANRLATGHAGGDGGVASRFIETMLETVPWVSAPALWFVLLGKWELPRTLHGTPSPHRRGATSLPDRATPAGRK